MAEQTASELMAEGNNQLMAERNGQLMATRTFMRVNSYADIRTRLVVCVNFLHCVIIYIVRLKLFP